MPIHRAYDASHGIIEAFQHCRADLELPVTGRFVQRPVHGIERHVEEEGPILFLFGDDSFRLGGDQIRGVAFFPEGHFVAVPIINSEASRSVVLDGVGVVIDSPGVVTILVHEAALQGQVLLQPLAQVPFPYQGGEIAGLSQGLSQRPFAHVQGVNSPRGFTSLVDCQGQSQPFQVTGLSEILRPPVHPGAKGVTPGEKRSPRGGTDGVGVELCQFHSLPCQLVDVRRRAGVTSIGAKLGPAQVIGQHEDDVRPASDDLLSSRHHRETAERCDTRQRQKLHGRPLIAFHAEGPAESRPLRSRARISGPEALEQTRQTPAGERSTHDPPGKLRPAWKSPRA